MAGTDIPLMKLLRVIAMQDQEAALRLIDASPALAGAKLLKAHEYFLENIVLGASVSAANRRGPNAQDRDGVSRSYWKLAAEG